MKRVLVTGAAGFIGQHLVQHYLENSNDAVVGVDVVGSPFCHLKNAPDWITLDLVDDADRAFGLIGADFDFIFHCAGSASVGFSIEQPTIDFQRNTYVLQNVLWALERRQFKGVFVFLSSASVYGNQDCSELSETMMPKPISPYALNKLLCEEICQYFMTVKKFDIRIARIFSAYGNGLKKQLLWDMLEKLNEHGEIALFGTGKEGRDFIHINDIVVALNLIANKGESGVYNVGNGSAVATRLIASIYQHCLRLDDEQLYFTGDSKEGDPEVLVSRNERLKNLGYEQTISISEGVKSYLVWAKKTER